MTFPAFRSISFFRISQPSKLALGPGLHPNRTVLLDLLVYHDWKKGLKFVGDMYFTIKMCFYTTELLHCFLDYIMILMLVAVWVEDVTSNECITHERFRFLCPGPVSAQVASAWHFYYVGAWGPRDAGLWRRFGPPSYPNGMMSFGADSRTHVQRDY